MSSLDKALQILSCFSVTRPTLGVSEAAQELGLPKSSVSRLMKSMGASGLLEPNSAGRGYTPGVLAFQLGNLYQRHFDVLDFIDEGVIELVERFGLTGYVGVLNGTEIVLLSVHQGSHPVRLVLEKGRRVPAHVTAIGLASLARKDDAEIRRLYPEPVHYSETEVTTSPDEILQRVHQARRDGFVAVAGHTFKGFNAIGVAVESPSERTVFGFALSYPEDLLDAAAEASIKTIATQTGCRIGIRTGDRYWLDRPEAGAGRAAMAGAGASDASFAGPRGGLPPPSRRARTALT